MDFESQFLNIPNADSCRKNLFILTQQPRIAGSPEDSALAVLVNRRFNEYGTSSQIITYYVYLPYPKSEELEMIEPEEYKFDLVGKGTIMLVRYGKSFCGIKVKVAEEYGAAGVIIYSDPQDDGYDQGDIYPLGPMKLWDAVQRGSIQDFTIYPRDPLTPGYASIRRHKSVFDTWCWNQNKDYFRKPGSVPGTASTTLDRLGQRTGLHCFS